MNQIATPHSFLREGNRAPVQLMQVRKRSFECMNLLQL